MFVDAVDKRARNAGRIPRGSRRQQGAILVLAAVSLLALMGMAALALDGGHMMLNKTRLQNAVDAAALSAAKTLDDDGSTTDAEQAAWNAFVLTANGTGNNEIADAFGAGVLADATPPANFVVDFADELFPAFACTEGCLDPAFVRVTVTDVPLTPFFMVVLGLNDKNVAASAVSGPSPNLSHVCDVVPLMMCGNPDVDPEDDDFFGYDQHGIHVLKIASGDESAVGPGNFQLLAIGDPGANVLRENLAGSYEACLNAGEEADTKPGNNVGPVVQGLNVRIGEYSGPMGPEYTADYMTEYPVDPTADLSYVDGEIRAGNGTLIESYTDLATAYGGSAEVPNYSYQYYDQEYSDNGWADDGSGQYRRREITVPVGDCSSTINGSGEVHIWGFACFFLLQPVIQQGNNAQVFGQLFDQCTNGGAFTMNPTEFGPTKIVLYKNPDSNDS